MSYDSKIMLRARARYDEAKDRRESELRARRRRCYAQQPRIEEIDRELSRTMAKIIANGLRSGADTHTAIAAIRTENLRLQRERGELLRELGYSPDYLEDKPACPLCGDTGWIKNTMCKCLQRCYIREQNAELSRMLNLGSQSFDTFDINYYSDTETFGRKKTARENMERVSDICMEFAHHFPSRVKNLLLTGDPGLGKTFLSACIAREVSEKGFSVYYDTAIHVFSRFEKNKFSRDRQEEEDESAAQDVERVLRCDLLILDDLGTELASSFIESTFYQIINKRLQDEKSTIISTNLNPQELGNRYGAAAFSRIRGEYTFLPFFGEDIRILKKR